jgi:Domain of unknown function (DUF4157)
MSAALQTRTKAAPAKPALTPARAEMLQRKCACGGSPGLTGDCEECGAEKRLALRRYSANRAEPSSLTRSLPAISHAETLAAVAPGFGHNFAQLQTRAPYGIQTKLNVSQPGDRYEEEADRVAEQVIRASAWSGAEANQPSAALSSTRLLIQRQADDEIAADTEALPTPAPSPAGPASTEAAASAGLIAEDGAQEVGPEQMRKSEFLDELRSEVCAAADAELAAAGRSTEGCPYIERAFERYRNFSAAQLERSLRRYAPEAVGATTARNYISAATGRVRRAVAVWATTGKITGVPEGMMTASPEARPSKGAESAASAPGGVQFKSQDGGAAEAGNPAAIQARLGSGRPLDTGVKSRMESAFGYDFSRVRVHTDAKASELSSGLRARAFTIGSDVAFRAGEYRPGTLIGDALIAHELAHVVQQGSGALTAASKDDASEKAFEDDADSAAVGAVLSLWGRAQGKLSRVARNVGPGLRSGLRVRRCNEDEATREVKDVAPTTEPAPPPASKPAPPPKLLYEQFETPEKRQEAVDKVVKEMGGKIDASLMERGKMFYFGDIVAEGTTYEPNSDFVKTKRKFNNRKPYVEIYGGAFMDGWPLLRTTVWHEYQHVLQMAPKSSMVVPGFDASGSAQETEAYCIEIIEAERQNLHLEPKAAVVKGGKTEEMTGKDYIEKVLWRRLTSHWGKVKNQKNRKRLLPLVSKAKEAAERMVGKQLSL